MPTAGLPQARFEKSELDSVIPGITRPVFILAIVSFLTDVSSKMIYPLVPLLTSVLGAPLVAVGLIEGIAEGVSQTCPTSCSFVPTSRTTYTVVLGRY